MHKVILLLALLLCAAFATSLAEAEGEKPDSLAASADAPAGFTAEQLDRARRQLSSMFDTGLDSDKDGRLTLGELTEWLARQSAAQADSDIEDSWRAFNLSDESPSFLDWDTYATRMMMGGKHRSASLAPSDSDSQAAREAAVRRAILEASRESGLDKAGLKVSMPEMPHQNEEINKNNDEEQKLEQHQLATELARDRRRWDAADADGDGTLSRGEFRDFALAESNSPRVRSVLALEALERMDTDGDGRVSEAEFLGAATEYAGENEKDGIATEERKNFHELWDTDKDGYLNGSEVASMLDYLDTPGAVVKDQTELHKAEANELLAAADANKDGSLTKEEVLAGVEGFAASRATHYGDLMGIHDEL